MVTSAIASLIILIPLPYILPFVEWSWPEWQVAAMALVAGALIQFSHFLYFNALAYSQAGIVSAYWNLVPVITPILSLILFRKILTPVEYVGIAILVLSSIYILSLGDDLHTGRKALFLMILAAFLQACAYIITDGVYEHIPFLQGYMIMLVSLIAVGISPLFIPKIRRTLHKAIPKLSGGIKIIIFIEIVYLLSLASAQKAISLGNPSLVAAIETTMPAFTFMLAIFFISFRHTARFGDPKAEHKIFRKLLSIGVMCIGVWMVS